MIELTQPQVWTLIGVFSTMLFAVFATTSGYLVRTMNAGFDRVDAKIDGLREEMNAKIAGLQGEMNAKFSRVDAQFDRVDTKFELVDVKLERIDDRFNHLDRDVQALSRRVFPDA